MMPKSQVLGDLVTVVVISARPMKVLPYGLSKVLKNNIKLLLIRPSALPRLDLSAHPLLNIIYHEQSFFSRFFVALKNVTTPYVFLSADDDFIVIENLWAAISHLRSNGGISLATQTLYCESIDTRSIVFSECYNHFKYSHEYNQSSPQKFAQELVYPLSIDFYTLYDTQLIFNLFSNLLRPEFNGTWKLDFGMKAIQFFLALLVALSGKVTAFNGTLYIRDKSSVPLRFAKTNGIMHPNLALRDDYSRIRKLTSNYSDIAHWMYSTFPVIGYSELEFRKLILAVEFYSLSSIPLNLYSLPLSNYKCRFLLDSDMSRSLPGLSFSRSTNTPILNYIFSKACSDEHFAFIQMFPTLLTHDKNRIALKMFSKDILAI